MANYGSMAKRSVSLIYQHSHFYVEGFRLESLEWRGSDYLDRHHAN
jgi:hypothetical protein